MVPLDYVLAVAVLTSPPGTGTQPPPAAQFASLRPTLLSLAVSWELLDKREVRYVLAHDEEIDADLDFLRHRHCNLRDAPPLSDCERLPDQALASELLAFNRAYRQHLGKREQAGGPWPAQVSAAIREADQLYQVWDSVRDARSDCYYVTVRRQALRSLREAIGPEAYACGRLPPHVPLWRFTQAD